MTVRAQNAEVEKLTAELFEAVQGAQGLAFVGDGETFPTVPEFFARIRGRLKWNEEASRLMRAFLKKHGQYGQRHPVKAGPSRIAGRKSRS